jgi:hypothetical protein
MFESLRLFEKVYMRCVGRTLVENRKITIDLDVADSRYLLIFEKIVEKIIKREDQVHLKLNRVSIGTNHLPDKFLLIIFQFLAKYRIRELVFMQEDIDLDPISSSLEEITIGYMSSVYI